VYDYGRVDYCLFYHKLVWVNWESVLCYHTKNTHSFTTTLVLSSYVPCAKRGQNKHPVFPQDALIWFTDGSRADSGTRSGIFGLRPNRSLSFPLGKFTTVFLTEIYAILQCACENIIRAYKNKRTLIFSDSQAALKALSSPKVTSELIVECLNALSALAGLNEVTLTWVPGHRDIIGNEETGKLAIHRISHAATWS
jgi:ribonuclease HI